MHRLYRNVVSGPGAIGLLILRLVAGLGLMLHGSGKIQQPFGWMGPDATVPGFLQALAAVSEFFGGLALIIGLLTPIAAFGVACTMAFATFTHMVLRGDPFVSKGGGAAYEQALVYLAIALLFLLIGPGKYSLDALVFGRRRHGQVVAQTSHQ